MSRKKLKEQIAGRLIITFLVISVVFCSLVVLIERQRYQDALRSVELSLHAIITPKINSLGHQIFFKNVEGIAYEVSLLMKYEGVEGAEVYDKSGQLLHSSYSDIIESKIQFPDRIEDDYFVEMRSINSLKMLEYLAAIKTLDDHHGYIRVFSNVDKLYKQIQLSGLIYFCLIISLFFCSVFIVSRMLRVLVTQPLLKISDGMHLISKGKQGVQVDLASENELGTITEVFNQMSLENSQMHHQLQEINKSLEKQVVFKTEELDKSQSILASVLSSSHDGIMVLKSILDEKGEIADFEWLMANPQAAANFTIEVSSIVGKQLFNRKPSLSNEELFDELCEVVQTKTPLCKEIYCEFEHKRGWFHVTAVVIHAGVAVTFRDVTQRKMLELSLQRKAEIDGLTQLANRGYFDQYIEEEWQACIKDNQPLGLLFIDVDYFKAYNDNYGHLAGDDCLKKLAEVLIDAAGRPRDLAARYGGEEFVVLLPQIDLRGVLEVVEKIRRNINELSLEHKKSTISDIITVSMGVSFTQPTSEMDLTDFIESSDITLYKSKSNGRNRYTLVEFTSQSKDDM